MNRSIRQNRRNKYLKDKKRKGIIFSKVWWIEKISDIDHKDLAKFRGSSPWIKTNNNSWRKRRKPGNYAKSYNPSRSDVRKLNQLYFEIKEFIPSNYYKVDKWKAQTS